MFAASVGCALFPACARAGDIDTEHLFGFIIGTDTGDVGEREVQSQADGRFGKGGGHYRALGQELELEFVPAPNFRVEVGSAFASYGISGVPGLDDQRRSAWQGASLDLRYRFLDRQSNPFGLTVAFESHAERIDETTAAIGRIFGTELTLALDHEVIPNVAVAALNLIYQPEWSRLAGSGSTEAEASTGVGIGMMAQVRPGVFVGAEVRYLRKYDGVALDQLAGQALFAGPTLYLQLSERARLTFAWSIQAWGRADHADASLDLVNFERHQARLILGVNF
jgi:hypothetical protein